MKTKIILSLFTVLISTHLFAQIELKIGDKTPEITITEFVVNTPKEKNFKNKYVVLEFWATWCAPCLAAVPHLNELQEKYKSKKDLVFISMTYEKVEKVLRTTQRISFKSIVVTDQTKKTHIDLGVEKNGGMLIPVTLLIDNKGILKWIGYPNQLDEKLMDLFINDKEVLIPKAQIQTSQSENSTTTESEKMTDKAFKLILDKETKFFFTVLNTTNEDDGITMKINGLKKGRYGHENEKLNFILSELIKVPFNQILIPQEIKDKKFSVYYKTSNVKSEVEELIEIKNNLIKSLNLKEKIITRKEEVYLLKILDKEKLQLSDEKEEGHSGENGTHLLFSDIKIQSFIDGINKEYNLMVFNEDKLDDKYDFIIRKGTLQNLIDDLKIYGLTIKKTTKEVTYYVYE